MRTDGRRKIKHFPPSASPPAATLRPGVRQHEGVRRLVVTVVAASLLLSACGRARPRENVQPPSPGVPAAASDVQGIYRTIHQGVMQLRGNGTFAWILPEGPGASGGRYTLADGTFTVVTDDCGDVLGEYRLTAGGQPIAGKATLHFVPIRDECAERARYLTIDPWVYADS
jgi:hypothetical protein